MYGESPAARGVRGCREHGGWGSAGDPDEDRVGLPDRAELDRLAGPRGVDLHVVARVDADVPGAPDDVTRLGVAARDDRAGVLLGRRRARKADAELAEHVLR